MVIVCLRVCVRVYVCACVCKCEFARACTVLIVFNYCKNNYKTIQIYFHFFFIGGVGGMGGVI